MTLIMKNNCLKFEKTACDLFKLGSYFVHERKMKDDSVLHKTVVYFHKICQTWNSIDEY